MFVYLSHVDAGIPVAEGMSVSKFSDDGDWIQACIFGQSSGDYLQCIGISLEAIGLHAFQ